MRPNAIVTAALVVACNCDHTQAPPPLANAVTAQVAALQAQATDDYATATALEASIARGRLIEARELATRLAVQTRNAPLRDAAQAIAHAPDVPAMAIWLGALGAACGAYHQANRATVALPAAGFAPTGTDENVLMRRHYWAATRLWEGLSAPDDTRWRAGARVLTALDIDVAALMHEKPNEDVVMLAEQLRDRALQATRVTEPGERARVYGEMLGICASCHAIVRPVPVPAR